MSRLSPDVRARAVDTLSVAFEGDPGMANAFPEADRRRRRLAALFAGAVRAGERYGGIEVLEGGAGVAVWLGGERFPLVAREIVRSGMVWAPLRVGVRRMVAFQRAERPAEAAVAQAMPEGAAYLWMLGVHPDAAGTGLGRRTLDAALGAMRAAGHTACVLKTENERNVGLYRHLGFDLVGEHDGALRSWIFRRPLAATDSPTSHSPSP